VRIALDESVPDHSTISRTRRLMDVETHQAVFQWVLQVLAEKKLLKGTTIGVDATTLEANAARGRLCGATQASATKSFSCGWRKKAVSKRPHVSS
jgi:hypothetical protein